MSHSEWTNIVNGKPTCEIRNGTHILGFGTWKAFPLPIHHQLAYLDTQEEATIVAAKFAASDEMLSLLKEIVDSDMAQREEDEDRVSPLLDRCRALIRRVDP